MPNEQIEVRPMVNPASLLGAQGYPAPYVPTGLETLDGISAELYNKVFRGNIKGAVDAIRFSRLRVVGGTAVGTGDKTVFDYAVGGNKTTADGGTAYKATQDDTNMRVASEMEYGNFFIVERFEVEVLLTAQVATADTTNEVTDPTAASAAATTTSASINLRTLLVQSWLTFTVGDRTILEGRLIDFPMTGGIGGVAGAADEGIFQNGLGFGRALREIIVLRPGEQFGVTIRFPTNFTPTQDIDVVVKLCGVRLRPVG